jgi:SCY1-like protein 2
MPLVYLAFEKGTFLQEKALKVSGELAEHLDFVTVKSTLFPKVANVFTHTTTLGIKLVTLDCFLKMVPKLDNVILIEDYHDFSSQLLRNLCHSSGT